MHRSWGQEFVEWTAELLASPIGTQRLIERKTYVEGAFGLAAWAEQAQNAKTAMAR